MTRRRSPALTCRNLGIPAGRDPGAAESRALGDAGSATPANVTCRLPLEDGAPSSVCGSSAADMCTPQKHTTGHASGSIDAAHTPRSHTSEACSPSVPGDAVRDGAPSAAVSPAGAREAGGAVLAAASANEPTCANTAPRGRCLAASGEAGAPPPVDPPFSADPPGVPTAASHRNRTEEGDSGASSGIAESRISETAISGSDQRPSAGLVAHRVLDVLVAGAGVDHRALDALVSGDPLGQEDVLGPLVDVGDSGVAERVEPERLIEAGALLPGLKHEAEGPGRDSLTEPRDEQRSVEDDALAVTLFPDDELIELVERPAGSRRPCWSA